MTILGYIRPEPAAFKHAIECQNKTLQRAESGSYRPRRSTILAPRGRSIAGNNLRHCVCLNIPSIQFETNISALVERESERSLKWRGNPNPISLAYFHASTDRSSDFEAGTTVINSRYLSTVRIHHRDFQKHSIEQSIYLAPIDEVTIP